MILEFEGVYMDSTVYLNGEKIGGWIYGYTNFFVDLTGRLKTGVENELLVEVDNSRTPNSRWYSGSGIYRPVNLWTGSRCHIKPQGLRVKTMSIDPPVIQVAADIEGADCVDEDLLLEYTVRADGKKIASAVIGCHEAGAWTKLNVPGASLWSAEEPNLYTLTAVLKKKISAIDKAETSFGIRSLQWDAQKGFQVNGQTVKLRGGCIHHDHGILGACTYDQAEYRRVKLLKDFGFNALRYSHYPAGKSFLEACDKLGMYVLDESFDQWRIPNTKYDYSTCFDRECKKDLEALAAKDFNHPSVIMYCIGNEISDTGRSYGAALASELKSTLLRMDDTRPITIATNVYLSVMASFLEQKELEAGKEIGSIEVNEVMSEVPAFKETLTPEKIEALVGESFDAVDIAGYNYGHDLYEKTHEMKKDRIILSSETTPAKMASNWKAVEDNDYCIGDFLWTAWDYLGEAGVGLPVYGNAEAPFAKPYPCLTAACGSFDLTGYPEAAAYYESVLWGIYRKPYIAVRPVDHSDEPYTVGGWRLTDALACWTWEGCEGKKAEIIVYSVGKSVEIFQDGISLGRKELVDCKAEFETIYHDGFLEAISYDAQGDKIGAAVLKTAGKQVRLSICPEEKEVAADPERIVYVPVYVTDENNSLRMTTDKKIQVKVEGAGRLLALGSGRPETKESFKDPAYTSWHGRVLAVIRCSGQPGVIEVTASAPGCAPVSARIQAI